MYYQEKWEKGSFYIKTTPNGKWKAKIPTLADIYQAIENKYITLHQGLDLAYLLGKREL